MIAKILPMDASPDKPTVGVDIDLRHAQFGGGQIFVLVNAPSGGIEFAAGADRELFVGDFV